MVAVRGANGGERESRRSAGRPRSCFKGEGDSIHDNFNSCSQGQEGEVQCSIDSNSAPSLSSPTPLGLPAPSKGVLLYGPPKTISGQHPLPSSFPFSTTIGLPAP